LTGWVTGPSKEALADGATETERLTSAITAVLYHELMILAAGGLITWVSWGQPNKVALWTFLVLWIMRCSAKLNLFLGVRNIGTEFLPDRMGYLGSFFRVRKMNWLFPFSVVGSIAAIVYLVMVALQSNNSSATSTGLFLVVALLGLALLEHWFMVLPVQPSALWKWAMNRKNSRNESEHTGLEKSAMPLKTPREIL
jgi:putative photosynthetic complex assembly protein 2